MLEFMPLILFACVCIVLMMGYPVAFTLAGVALLFGVAGHMFGVYENISITLFSERMFGIMTNRTLVAVPLFILLGVMLEKSKIAEDLLDNMGKAFGRLPGGLGISVVLVGMLLAASTGIVGATVVTMGLISLPIMLKRGYNPSLATGTICATGTLGQIIPPSIALVLLGDILSSAYNDSQRAMGIFNSKTVSIGDLFIGAIVPGLILVVAYILYVFIYALIKPSHAPAIKDDNKIPTTKIITSLVPPLALIGVVLGSILMGKATPTEAAGLGAMGATFLALIKGKLNLSILHDVVLSTLKITTMVFTILIGASLFSLVFRGYGGDDLITHMFDNLPGGRFAAIFIVMLIIFLLGFILDFVEITFVVVPIVAPVLFKMGVDPVWLGIMIALNLQTSFLTPPFGFALFYLRGVAPKSVQTKSIYKGVIPFIILQVCVLVLSAYFPDIITWLPERLSQ